MSASIQQARRGSDFRLPTKREIESAHFGVDRTGRMMSGWPEPTSSWLVDLIALARCRDLFARTVAMDPAAIDQPVASHLSFIDVPTAYDNFCRTHFSSVKRLHPELCWEDVCPVYAIALIAHSTMHTELSENRENQLSLHWPQIRGQSGLAWSQARSLIADGCKALSRLDPLANAR